MPNMMLNSVTFSEKHDVAQRIRRLAERLPVCPLSEYFLTFSQSFAEMTRPKLARKDMSPQQTRAKNFRKNTKATNPPKIDNEGKKPSASKRINPRDPTIPSWRHGFFTAIHSVLADNDLDNLSKSATTESFEEAPGDIIEFKADTSGTDA
uniref:Uncharacterized protein n=1 Tax=Solanum tuberosum TaxID=4113 RepID=M1DMW4_SOLTU